MDNMKNEFERVSEQLNALRKELKTASAERAAEIEKQIIELENRQCDIAGDIGDAESEDRHERSMLEAWESGIY